MSCNFTRAHDVERQEYSNEVLPLATRVVVGLADMEGRPRATPFDEKVRHVLGASCMTWHFPEQVRSLGSGGLAWRHVAAH